MKKSLKIFMILFLAAFFLTSCGKMAVAPKAGSASAEDMLKLIPKDVKGILFIDFHKAMGIESVTNAITENKDYEKYQEFVEKSGIDPQKDIYLIAVGITASPDAGKGVAIINLKYNKDTLLSIIKEESEAEFTEEDYNGMTIYKESEKNEGCFAFIDESNIVAGNEPEVKSVLDIVQNNGENIYKNEELSALLAKSNKDTIFWGTVSIPPDVVSKATSDKPMLSALEAVNAVFLNFDYKNQNIIAEIKGISSDTTKNQQIADMLNGLKAFGAMAANEKPEIGELVNKIQITSTEDYVKISASIPEELMVKLKEDLPASPIK